MRDLAEDAAGHGNSSLADRIRALEANCLLEESESDFEYDYDDENECLSPETS